MRPTALLLLPLLPIPALAQNVSRWERAVVEQLQLDQFELVSIELPADLPQTFRTRVILEGRELILDLARTSPRAEGFKALALGADGQVREVAVEEPRTYGGIVEGWPGMAVGASLTADGLKAALVPAEGEPWFLEPLRDAAPAAPRHLHVLSRGSGAFARHACGTFGAAQATPPPPPPSAPTGNCVKLADIVFDVDFERYTTLGSTVQAVVNDIDAVMVAVNVIYARDLLIAHQTGSVLVRTSEPDPYSSFDPGTLLNQFRDEWNANQGGVARDVAHFITGRDMTGNIIGLAWVGVVCNKAWAYGLSQFTFSFSTHVTLIAHEVGHNWAAPHCDGSEGCGVMCGGCHQFTPASTKIMMNYAANAACLDDIPGHSDPVPPRAFDESAFVDSGVSLTLDVLGNDHDGNCDPLSIDAFDSVSNGGGTVQLSPGTGPGGRDELIYTMTTDFEGTDRFTYTVGDGQGGQDVGTVTITVFDDHPDLALHLMFDDSTGVMVDSSPSGLDGTYFGVPIQGQPGAAPSTGLSVWFDGMDDRGKHPGLTPMNALRKNLTIATWVRTESDTGTHQFYGNSASWAFGQAGTVLYFHAFGVRFYTSSTAKITPTVWHHVAAVFDESFDVTFYVDGLQAGKAFGDTMARKSKGAWWVATHGNSNHFFNGNLDDLQIYDRPLTSDQISFLYNNPGDVLQYDCRAKSYCVTTPNSAGAGARITISGSVQIALDDFHLNAFEAPPNQFGLFFYGPGQTQTPVADGQLCVSGQLARLPVVQTDVFGVAVWGLDFMNQPPQGQITPGSTWNFQFWYRDPTGGSAGSNFTDGVSVTFCP